MITKTIRIEESQEKFILENYKGFNQGIVACIQKVMYPGPEAEILKYVRAYSRRELKGKFTLKEWYFFFDSLNGSLTEGMFRCNAGALIAHCQDAELFDATASKYKLNIEELILKIKSLTGAQVDALYAFVEEFWNDETRNMEQYANILT